MQCSSFPSFLRRGRGGKDKAMFFQYITDISLTAIGKREVKIFKHKINLIFT
jgi:hypothetical protein